MKKTPDHDLPIVAIVGRPNVGKSSLFNRLIHKRLAITSQVAGTTRDRIYYHTDLGEIPAIVVDTGGMEYGKKANIEADVQAQARLALEEADLIVFVVDVIEGLTANDHEAAKILRKTAKPVMMVANKYDHGGFEENIPEIHALGFGDPVRISVIHKMGLEELEEQLAKQLKKMGWKKIVSPLPMKEDVLHLCFVGRPNAGKSSLVNALLGEEKLIVSNIPGTTRDAVDTGFQWQNHHFNFIDTAGIRRRGRIERGLEKLSTLRSLEAIERSDVVCLILDYEAGVTNQDQHIAAYILDAGKGLMLVVNKSDLMENEREDSLRFIRWLRSNFDFLPWAPVLFVSALAKRNLEKILELSLQIGQERIKTIDADELDGFMKEITYKHLPPHTALTRPKIYRLVQDGIRPPTFVFDVNDGKALHFSYRRYLENEIRKKYLFTGTSIRLIFKSRPLTSKRKRREKG